MKVWIAIACTVGLGASIVHAASSQPGINDSGATTTPADGEMVDRFLNSGKPALTSYTARRVLTASTMGGRMGASLEAMTSLAPDGTFSFQVIREDGSGLIRSHVLLPALEAEQRTRNERVLTQSELTPANYEFRLKHETRGDGLARVLLFPRRQTPMLLTGTVTVRRHDGDIVRIDGSPSQSPSWWTKHVDIVRSYGRVAGVRVPIEMASRADVRLAGESTFSMVYEYRAINGRAVGVVAGETGTGRLW